MSRPFFAAAARHAGRALLGMYLLAASGVCDAAGIHAHEKPTAAPGCVHESPLQCVTAALEAMGGSIVKRCRVYERLLEDGAEPSAPPGLSPA